MGTKFNSFEKEFIQQDSFQDSEFWNLNLALKLCFVQDSLLLQGERHKEEPRGKLQGQMI